jgi:peptidyl-prolyl cis-trans isomerase A (cyclophilin A)
MPKALPLLALALVSLAACGGGSKEAADSTPPAQAPPAAATSDAKPAAEKAPAQYKVRLATTKGDIVIEVYHDWAPLGADRFYDLVKAGYFDNAPWFRVIAGFMVQTGLNPDPQTTALWRDMTLPDDPVTHSNTEGMVTFAMGGPNTRSTHFFINTGDNSQLDSQGFAPFGKVVEGMDVVKSIYEIGDGTVDQGRANMEGEEYFKTFSRMDRIKTARIE